MQCTKNFHLVVGRASFTIKALVLVTFNALGVVRAPSSIHLQGGWPCPLFYHKVRTQREDTKVTRVKVLVGIQYEKC